MDLDAMKHTRIRRSRVHNIDNERLLVRRAMLMDTAGYVRDRCDGSKRHFCQLIGERVGIEGELLRRGIALAEPILPASYLARDILAEGGTLQPQGPRR